ncbi:MAG: 7-carboxy-7-deazaguanine synthase QueE [Pseudomonadota bacterium]
MADLPRLRITEIFHSLQGEAHRVGWPSVFVRLTGCPLRCDYCDTSYAFQGGNWWEIDAILAEVAQHATPYVCVTGGEPLAQKNCLALLTQLCDAGYSVSLETSGALSLEGVDVRVEKVMDLKSPSSGEMRKNLYTNLALLTKKDQIKIVIATREDYDWAKQMLAQHRLNDICSVLFSPSHGKLAGRELADWILTDHLPVRMQIQLHKYLWGDERGR